MPDSHIGESITRLEDDALLTGAARFVDDIRLDGMVHAAFVRSPFAHARLGRIETTVARSMPGVFAIYTLDDLRDVICQDRIPEGFPKPPPRTEIGPYVLARDEVCYVGEPVAVVFAETRYQAEDAVQFVDIEYDPLPVVSDCRIASEPNSPPVDTRGDGNLVTTAVKSFGNSDAAFDAATHVVRETILQHRGVAMSMECRGAVARFDPLRGRLTMWASSQAPHSHRSIIVYLLGLTEEQVRIIIPSVGGGFGPKLNFYPEDAVVTAAAVKLGRPVKWIEDRREHLLTTTQERDQIWEVEMAADAEGRVLGLRGHLYHDQGAYTVRGTNIPFSAATTILGPYVIPSYHLEISVAHTNKVPATSMRGAGHPQGCFTMERLLDRIAQATGKDRADVRQINLIKPDQMPFEQPLLTQAGQKIIYDSGDYVKCQTDLLAAVAYESFPERQRAARAEGRYLGIGLANYVKPTGRGPFETGLVRIGTSGKVSVYTGGVAMGQGFHTAMAQICADQLGVSPKDVTVIAGDTDTVSMGIGGFASRLSVCAGSSIHLAAVDVRHKVLRIAANLLEASAEDLELIDGKVFVKGVPGMSIGFAEIADAVAGIPGVSLPEGISAGLEAEANFQPENVTYANGAHAAEVEVDPGTGAVKITRYVVVHDSGRLINPMLVDGQVQGGVTLGVGHALFEWMIYDDAGQPQTTNLAEYLVPTAPEVPHYQIIHQVSPTDRNPIGVKGVGECGVMSAAPSVISAIENALEPFGVRIDRYPITPVMLVEKIAASKTSHQIP
jgi:carbon-monoxide dehydrogenase large subunit